MYTLIRHAKRREALARAALACPTSLLIAETFYKFHSLTLECLAFLATWVLDFALSLVTRRFTQLPMDRRSSDLNFSKGAR